MNIEQRKKLHAKYGKAVNIWLGDDYGYGGNCKVIDERLTSRLFGDTLYTELLVERGDGTREWVADWKEIEKRRK